MPKRKADGPPDAVAKTRRAIAEGRARADHYLKNAPRCDVCGSQVASPGRTRHYSCDPDFGGRSSVRQR